MRDVGRVSLGVGIKEENFRKKYIKTFTPDGASLRAVGVKVLRGLRRPRIINKFLGGYFGFLVDLCWCLREGLETVLEEKTWNSA